VLYALSDQATFDSLRVLHSEPDPFDPTRAIWVDRTILSPDTPSPDFANRNISARVNEVGPFVIARLTQPQPPNTNVADLSVTISESADPVVAGNELTYTVNVTNNGPNVASGVVLNNGLSPDVSFVSADAPQRFCNEFNGTVICDLGGIGVGVTIPVTIVVKPNEGMTRFPTEGKAITNAAFVRANESDPDMSNNSRSESTTALPNPNAPPSVQIQSPATDAIMTGPASFSVILKATDSDGTISQVELFDNGESVGMGTPIGSGQYSVTRSNLSFGEHSLLAVATDNGGRKAVSNSVRFFVNGPAAVSLDSPIEGSLFGRPASVVLTATTTIETGSITQVEFLDNGTSIGISTVPIGNQYSFTWNQVSTGRHSIRAVATDSNGIKSYSEASVIYVTNSPTVSIVSPTSGSTFAKFANISLTANARDFDGYISKVEFFANGTTLLGTGTLTQADVYTFTWTNAPAGTYSITAVATDDWGKTSTSSPISVTVTNAAPTVILTSPTNGATFIAPANITLNANATDSDGTITKVEFFNGTNLLNTDTTAPYSFVWNNVAVGSYTLTAKATDDDGAVTTSTSVSITVNPVGNALFVVGNTTLNSVDNAIKTRLQNLGLNVIIKSATSATSGDATGKRVVVISDTVSPANVNTKFRTVTVPVVTLDPQLFDDMGMCATSTGNFGTTTSQKNVTITNSTHPMASGLSGTVQVTSSNTTFGWAKVNANGLKIATLTSDSTKATDFGYESGVVMPGLTAPARRVGFFYTASSSSLTTNEGLLFDNAIRWAAGL
jgi:uncharacterized repeat protein (TIGR01451 family)